MKNIHYYSKELGDLKSNPNRFNFEILNNKFVFNTDDGVFCKNYIDYGSQVLIKSFKPNDIDLPILDMGAGYGPIGIVLSKVYDKDVIMCEINPRSCMLNEKNINDNKAIKCKCINSDLYDKVNDLMFSSVVTNPPIRAGKSVVFSIYEGAYNRLVSGGELWVVIQKKQGAPSSKEYINTLFGNCEIVKKDSGYYILYAKKN